MKRRLLAIVLVLTLVLGLASCGGKNSGSADASLAAQIDKMSEMEAGYGEVIFDFDTDLFKEQGVNLSKVSIKGTSLMDKDNEKIAKVELSYKLDSAEYTKLTTMIVEDTVVYINLKELKAAAPAILEQLGLGLYESYLAMIPDAEYIKVDPVALSQLGGATLPENSLNYSKEDAKTMAKIVSEIVKAVEEAIKDVEPAVVSAKGDKVSINLTDKNAKATLEALSKADFSTTFDAVMNQMKDNKSMKEFYDLYSGKKTELLSELKEGLASATAEYEESVEFNLNYSVEVKGSKGKQQAEQEFTLSAKNEAGYLKVGITVNAEEGKKETVEIPTDATDFMELMNSLMGSMTY